MAEKRTEIQELREFGLIDRIEQSAKLYNTVSVKGIGDDAAVLDAGDTYILTSTDQLIEGVHFDLSYMPIKHLGYKSVAVNVSDIAAMNGKPLQVTVSIAISNRFSLEAIDALYEGINAACKNYKVDLVGGDTSASPSGLFISVTVLGEVDKDKITYRSGAGDKDILCVTGDLGGAYVGLQILEREKQVFLTNPEMQPKLDEFEYVVSRQLKPEARMDFIYELLEMGLVPTSMIDISDGLASDLMHLCKQSKLGARIFEDKLPIDKLTHDSAADFKINPATCALNGGEDYELLFTIKQDDVNKIEKYPDVQMIGYMDKKELNPTMVTRQENLIELTAQGWDHLRE